MRIDTGAQNKFDGVTIQVNTPEGAMFVLVMEDARGKPCAVQLFLGKAGGIVNTWGHAFSRLMTLALEKGASVEDFIEELSGYSSDKLRIQQNGATIRSGPGGVAYALMQYSRDRQERANLQLVTTDAAAERVGSTRTSRMADRRSAPRRADDPYHSSSR